MKKKLFFLAAAAVALASCSSDETTAENSSASQANQPKEIAFSPFAQKATRAAVETTTFPEVAMQVAAWDVTNSRDFFTATAFSKNGETWKGGKYWPLSAAYINFLAYAEFNAGTATWNLAGEGKAASGVTLAMDDNYTAQKDLMYAIGNGQVTQSGNALSFPPNVSMTFKHAQAFLVFNVKAANSASTAIHITNIEVQDAYFAGTAVVTHTNYNASEGQTVSVAWSSQAKHGSSDPNYNSVVSGAPIDYTLTTTSERKGAIMVVPATTGLSNIKISYTLDSKPYTYVYEPASKLIEAGKKYTYDITFNLHEIEIAPAVDEWIENTEYINIPTMTYGANPTYALANRAKGTYTFTITGLTEGHFVKVTDDHASTGKFTVTSPASTYTVTANGTVTITGTLADNEGSAATSVITLKQYPTSDDASAGTNEEATFETTITITQAGS